MFCEDPLGSVQFHEATHLTASDWDQLQQTVRHRVLPYFHRHGLLERHVTDDRLSWQASGGFSIDYLNSPLLVVDEVGFRPLDRQEANLFFHLVSARYEKGSIILTSNKKLSQP